MFPRNPCNPLTDQIVTPLLLGQQSDGPRIALAALGLPGDPRWEDRGLDGEGERRSIPSCRLCTLLCLVGVSPLPQFSPQWKTPTQIYRNHPALCDSGLGELRAESAASISKSADHCSNARMRGEW